MPATYLAVTGELATDAQHNDPLEDIQADLNTARPIVVGGTGADTAVEALDALTVKSGNIASAGTTDLSAASGRFVHITGTTTITAFTTQVAGIERVLVFDGILTLTHNATTLILPGGVNIVTAAGDSVTMISEGSGNWRCINYQPVSGIITPWVIYTPTYTGFGTVVTSSMWSRRVGDSLYIRGKFTVATSTAVEARMTLGFNGTNGVITSDATKVPAIQLAGHLVLSISAAAQRVTLIESNVGYITFGAQTAGAAGLTKLVGSSVAGSTDVISLMAEIPITGW